MRGILTGRNLMGTALAWGAAATVLTACSSGSGAQASGEAGSATQTVEVKATEFALSLPTTTFAPGTYTFVMNDAGHATHAIELQGPGVDGVKSDTVGPGASASLTATLQKGTYTLWCPVGNHRAQGMQTTLTVG